MRSETDILIDDLLKHKPAAQEKLLSRYGPMVFRLIARIVTQQEDAEEVYQDVFVKAFRNIGTYDSGQASLATWLSRITYNEALNFTRRTRPVTIYLEERNTELESIEDSIPSEQDEDIIQLMEQALDHLSPDDQALINMFYHEDLSLKEIAYITDSIPSTIGSKLSRIRKKLYQTIKTMQQ